jgi:hypothetical protein
MSFEVLTLLVFEIYAVQWQGLLGGLNGPPKHSVSCLTGRGHGERRLEDGSRTS